MSDHGAKSDHISFTLQAKEKKYEKYDSPAAKQTSGRGTKPEPINFAVQAKEKVYEKYESPAAKQVSGRAGQGRKKINKSPLSGRKSPLSGVF